jgi:hypothetical protein
MFPAKEILDAIQNEAEFDNSEVEKAIAHTLEVLNKELIFVQFEYGTELEDAITAMNKAIADANSDIEDEEDEDDDEDDIIFEEDEDEEDEEPLILEDDTTEETEDAQPDPTQK